MSAYKSILLTGGGGFVGRYLSAALAKNYPSARRAILYQAAPTDPVPGWEALVADLTDESAIEAAIAALRPDLIVHLAAQSSVGQVALLGETTWRVNLGGTLALARAVARHAPSSTFFFASTSEVYGASFNDGIATEETPLRPLNAYSSSKAAAEQLLRDVLPQETRLIATRSFNHTGPGQDERFVLPAFAAQIARIEAGLIPPVLRVGNLDAKRDFLDVRDVVDAYCRLISPEMDLPSALTVNVASGNAVMIGDILQSLRALSRVAFEVQIDPARLRPSDIPTAVGDATRLRDLTGWAPKQPVQDTWLALLDWWRARVVAETR